MPGHETTDPNEPLLIEARRATLVASFEVRRVLPWRRRRMVGPFVFLDHGGPIVMPPERRSAADVLPHPHIGLATVSYLFGGRLVHRDGLGSEQRIVPHEVNWMTAGRGIAHSERFDDDFAEPFEMVQSWCALPAEHEEDAPSFAHHATTALPVAEDGGIRMRVIAGRAFGLESAVRVLSPLFYVHVEAQPGARLALPDGFAERSVYVVRGRVAAAGRELTTGQMLVFEPQHDTTLAALEHATMMLLGGEPIGERFIWWNFVSSRKERIEQAKADWQAGRIMLPPNDDRESIPLPDDGRRPRAAPLS